MWTCTYATGGATVLNGHEDYAVLSQYNQYYDIGGPGGDAYYPDEDVSVIYELDMFGIYFTDYTNEVPNFVARTWYKTDPDTQYGERKVGWAFIPEPLCGLALIAFALLALRRR